MENSEPVSAAPEEVVKADEVAEAVPTGVEQAQTEEQKATHEARLAARRREEKAIALMKKIRHLCEKDGFMLLPRVYYIPVPGRMDGAQIQRAEISLVDLPEEQQDEPAETLNK